MPYGCLRAPRLCMPAPTLGRLGALRSWGPAGNFGPPRSSQIFAPRPQLWAASELPDLGAPAATLPRPILRPTMPTSKHRCKTPMGPENGPMCKCQWIHQTSCALWIYHGWAVEPWCQISPGATTARDLDMPAVKLDSGNVELGHYWPQCSTSRPTENIGIWARTAARAPSSAQSAQ